MSAAIDLSTLGLSAEQKARRKTYLGGSEANIIMSGDEERILQLWREKLGLAEAEDLSNVLQVQLGAYTEPFNRAWYTKITGRPVACVGEERQSLTHDWMGCTLDGMVMSGPFEDRVFEAKHVSAFAKQDEIFARYLPQLTHAMLVCEVARADLSVIYGNHKHEILETTLDDGYAEALMEAEHAFWLCVQNRVPPSAVEVKAPVPATRTVVMQGSNEWAAAAADWCAHRVAAKHFDAATKALKALTPDDAVEAYGHRVIVKRSKAGSLTVSEMKGEQ